VTRGPVKDVVAGLGPRRAEVLAVLRGATAPLDAPTVAAQLGVHPNSARFHLEALVRLGLAERRAQDRSTPGRPAVVYAASATAPLGTEASYRELASALADAVSQRGRTPQERARRAGEAKGRAMAAEDTAGQPPVEAVVRTLARLGFESRPANRGRRIDITPCPFLDLVEQHGEVVCAVHHGLMDGVLEQLGASLEVDRLTPFAGRDRCAATLRRHATS
jgi:predicted ArsR family transcriptional regulator